MHRQPAVVAAVFQYNIMDKTLKDYITRTQQQLKEENEKPLLPNPNQYPVLPENKNQEDTPQNPYGQH